MHAPTACGQRRIARGAALLATLLVALAAPAADVALTIDADAVGAPLDLGRYAFGQGGLSSGPMLHAHIARLAQLEPRTIRVFVQEYYDLYPAHGVFHWDTLDATLRDVLATGARPIANICFKPATLYPVVDQAIVEPTSWDEWETLIAALVAHCRDQGFAVALWEIGNEGDIGESGGCPYLFTPENYVRYYAHTAAAIRRVDPLAQVGGPALAGLGPIGDALIAAAGRREVPLDVFSWHGYTSDPASLASGAASVRAQLRRHPALAATETMISEWNMDLGAPSADPAFQPAFALEATRDFAAAGLSRAAYYHLRDVHVDEAEFRPFMSPGGAAAMAAWWNAHPQFDGLFGFAGEERPTWRAFRWLSELRGGGVAIAGESGGVHAFAARDGDALHAVIWSFGAAAGTTATLALPATRTGFYRLARLDAAAVAVRAVRSGRARDLATPLALTLAPYDVYALDAGPVQLDPDAIAFSVAQGAAPPPAQDVVVHDVGADRGVALAATSDAPWLRVVTVAGAGDGQVLRASVDASGLPTGTSVATVRVERPGVALTFEATLRVVAAPPDGDTLHDGETPAIVGVSDGVAYELGTAFTADVAGEIRAIRFWSPAGDGGPHVGRIWSADGAVLATATFPDDGSVGWRTAALAAPLAIGAGVVHVVTVDTAGPYVATNGGLAQRIGTGAVHSVADGANGVYGARGAFPRSSYRQTDYFRDVVFRATATSGPIGLHGAQHPAIGDTSDGVAYELGAKFATTAPGRVTAIRFWQAPSDRDAHAGRIWSADGAVLATATFAAGGGAGWRSAPLAAPLALTPGATYVVTVDTAGPYAATNHGLAQPLGDGPLRTIADGANGVYGPRGALPRASYEDTDYFRDVEFTPDAAGAPATLEPSGDG